MAEEQKVEEKVEVKDEEKKGEAAKPRFCVVLIGVNGRELQIPFRWPAEMGDKVPEAVAELARAFNAKNRAEIAWTPIPGFAVRVDRMDYFRAVPAFGETKVAETPKA